MKGKRAIDELLSRRDPMGYYVLLAKREALELLKDMGVEVEEAGELVVVKTRSRSLARKTAKILAEKKLLVLNPY